MKKLKNEIIDEITKLSLVMKELKNEKVMVMAKLAQLFRVMNMVIKFQLNYFLNHQLLIANYEFEKVRIKAMAKISLGIEN